MTVGDLYTRTVSAIILKTLQLQSFAWIMNLARKFPVGSLYIISASFLITCRRFPETTTDKIN
jgi:hypothetical protein